MHANRVTTSFVLKMFPSLSGKMFFHSVTFPKHSMYTLHLNTALPRGLGLWTNKAFSDFIPREIISNIMMKNMKWRNPFQNNTCWMILCKFKNSCQVSEFANFYFTIPRFVYSAWNGYICLCPDYPIGIERAYESTTD